MPCGRPGTTSSSSAGHGLAPPSLRKAGKRWRLPGRGRSRPRRRRAPSRPRGSPGRSCAAVRSRSPSTAAAARSGIRLIGNWTWGPNATGLRWFADEVVPKLADGLEVVVAGSGAEWLRERAGIRYAGRVDDADAFLAAARVVAVPARAGA